MIDSAIDEYNATIIVPEPGPPASTAGTGYVFELGGLLDPPAAPALRRAPRPRPQPPWWTPYPLPPQLCRVDPRPTPGSSAPGLPPAGTDGGLVSLDGVHPTTIAYGIVAHEMVNLLRDRAGVPFFAPDGTERASRPSTSTGSWRRTRWCATRPDRSRRRWACSGGSTRRSTG